MIPYGRQEVTSDDIETVVEILRSDFLTQGPMVPCFEQAVADYVGASQAVAVNSATSALHLACRALDVDEKRVVWTTPISFVATANAALYCGATVDFVDIDPRTYNMSVPELEQRLEAAERDGQLPDVVIVVHMAGQSCEMEAIGALAQRYGFRIIEDASHAIGGKYNSAPVGGCSYSDIAVFSFHPVKIITTGEGGIATTNDPDLAHRMRLLRGHGITRDRRLMRSESDGAWYYEQLELGYNYRMADIGAALGLSQLERVDDYVRRRHEIAETYGSAFVDTDPLRLPWQHPDTYSSFHLYIVRVPASCKAAVFDCLRAAQIGVNVHYVPIYQHPYYAEMGFDSGNWPEAEAYYWEAITLPVFPTLVREDQDRVISAVKRCLGE